MITINISASVLIMIVTQVVSFFVPIGLADRHDAAVVTIDLHGNAPAPLGLKPVCPGADGRLRQGRHVQAVGARGQAGAAQPAGRPGEGPGADQDWLREAAGITRWRRWTRWSASWPSWWGEHPAVARAIVDRVWIAQVRLSIEHKDDSVRCGFVNFLLY